MSTSVQNCHLFLSPHLDDVVLSCALRVRKESHDGNKVVIATVFSKSISFLGLDLYRDRHNEDKQSLDILGVDNLLHLNFSDAPFRNLFYTSFQSIVLGKHPQDIYDAEKVSQKVILLYKEYAPKTIYLPLAIGTHIDHRLTHHMWCSLPSDANIIFYEDRPYVFLPQNLELRLAEIGATTSDLPNSIKDGNHNSLKSFSDGLKQVTFYKNIASKKSDRLHYILQIKHKLKSPTPEKKIQLASEIISTNAKEEVSEIEKAVCAYKSQFKMLYGDVNTFKQESATYTEKLSTNAIYAERYWKLIR